MIAIIQLMFSKVKEMSKTNHIRNAFSVLEQAKKESRPLIVFDTETTGLSSVEDTLIQVSAQKIDPESFKTLEKFDVIINPMRQVSEKITEITGYTNEFLATKLPEEFIFMDIFNFFGENPIVAGYNVDFDIRFMKACYQRNGKFFAPDDVVDVLGIARTTLRKGKDVPNHKLGTIASYYGVDSDLTFHEAQDDVTATIRVMVALLPEEKPEKANIVPNVNGVSYFLGYRGHNRLYFYSNAGAFYWDVLDKKFDSKDFNVSEADLDPGVTSICQKWHVSNIDELFTKVQNWWLKKQEARIGEEKQFGFHQGVEQMHYLSQNRVFDYTLFTSSLGITTVKFIAVNKYGGKCVKETKEKLSPIVTGLKNPDW